MEGNQSIKKKHTWLQGEHVKSTLIEPAIRIKPGFLKLFQSEPVNYL